MPVKSARQAYQDLARYFGLRQRDAFLSAINPSPATGKAAQPTPKDLFFNEMFGDGTAFKSSNEIADILENYKGVENDVCVTPGKEADRFPGKVLNKKANDQGHKEPKTGDHYSVFSDILPEKNDLKGDVSIYQVFPAARGLDITDTEIVTLFLSNLTSLDMTRAVPYIDIAVSTAVGKGGTDDSGNFTKNPHISLGRFLGADDNEMALRGKFLGHIGKSAANVNSDEQTNLQAVAGMEIFTTPQTLVDASDVKYNEASAASKGQAIDAFRPFLNLEGIDISIVPSGFGTIAYKTAKMTLKLFDRGRLRDIAPLVSPQRKGNVQFYITYGWSHPDGLNIKRSGDANGTRMGDLINAMKISEAYIVTNSSFSFGGDGVVSIDVDLAMLGTDAASGHDVLSIDGNDIKKVMNLMDGIQKKIRDLRGSLPGTDVRQLLSRVNEDSILNLSKADQNQLRKIGKTLRNHRPDLKDLSVDLSTLLGANSNASPVQKARVQAERRIKKKIDDMAKTPDPFLRAAKTVKKSKFGKYISFGKLITNFLTPVFGEDDDLQFVFSPFNYSAAAMFDHNISQFPIEIKTLQDKLKAIVKKKPKMSALEFLQFLETYFFSWQGNQAYGLRSVYSAKRDPKSGRSQLSPDVLRITKKSGRQLTFNNKMHTALTGIYGGERDRPTFTPPQVTMNIVTRKNEKTGKNITRITFFDAAAGQVMPIINTFNQAARAGHFSNENITSLPTGRGARHGEVIQATYAALRERKLILSLESYLKKSATIDEMVTRIREGSKGAGKNWPKERTEELKKTLENTLVFDFALAKNNLKALFFEFSPSLIYGTTTSGILSADLSSQQNDALLSMAVTNAMIGKDGQPIAEDMSLPLMVHPTTLKLSTFGCPHFRFSQKYFVDLGTNTTADNFYAVTGISHTIRQGEYKTDVDMIQTDAYGSFVHVESEIQDTIISAEIARLEKS